MTHFWSSQEEKKNPLIEFLYMALSKASLKNKFPLFNVNVNSCELFFFFFFKDDSNTTTQHNNDSTGGWTKREADLTLFILTKCKSRRLFDGKDCLWSSFPGLLFP